MSFTQVRSRIHFLFAAICFIIAMLFGGGAPVDFVDHPQPTPTPGNQP